MCKTLVLLAAGMSTRYGRLKQLEPVGPGGEALLDFAVFDAHRAGFNRTVLIIREELEDGFRRHIDGRWPPTMDVVFHHQRLDDLPGVASAELGTLATLEAIQRRKKPWGTAHALLTARKLLPDPFLVLNADDFYGSAAFVQGASVMEELSRRAGFVLPSFALVAYTLEDTLSHHGSVNRGICRIQPSGELKEVEEVVGIRRVESGVRGRTLSGDGVILSGVEATSTNCWAFTPDLFPLLAERFGEFLLAFVDIRHLDHEGGLEVAAIGNQRVVGVQLFLDTVGFKNPLHAQHLLYLIVHGQTIFEIQRCHRAQRNAAVFLVRDDLGAELRPHLGILFQRVQVAAGKFFHAIPQC